MSIPRAVASFLAIGACFWGLFLLVGFGTHAIVSAPTGLGYLVTVGYLLRAFTQPKLVFRYLIWLTSVLVNGGWLWWIIQAQLDAQLNRPGSSFEAVVTLWWIAASVLSIIAACFEHRDASQTT